jgi:iron complex transport system permease protein
MRRWSSGAVLALLAMLLFLSVLASAALGAFSFSPAEMLRYLGERAGWVPVRESDTLGRNVFIELRLPRVVLAAFTGAVLGVSGTLMQGVFRNPIVEPGLAGTSAGAALGAALVFVLGGTAMAGVVSPLGAVALPLAAFLGALAATAIVYRVSSAFGKVNVFTLLLAGIAVNAVCSAGTGFLSYMARDPQARNITFWNLGTFTTASWRGVIVAGVPTVICLVLALRHAKALNALMLGEEEAALLGSDPRRTIRRLLVINTVMVAAVTAMAGVIAFVGLVVPHMLRLLRSSDHAFVLPASALLGAALMVIVDLAARLVIPPAELPIGIITAIIGAPVFLSILLRQQRRADGGMRG